MGGAIIPNLISFTIDGTEYQAEEGMTWQDWIDSEYNVDGYYKMGLGDMPVQNPINNKFVAYEDGKALPADRLIINGYNYILTD